MTNLEASSPETNALEMTAETGYNYIYRSLVNDENDIIGIIAYSFYKQQKIEYIEDFRRKHGRAPTDEELDHFHQFSNAQSQLESYRIKAVALAKEFLDVSLSEKAEELDKKYANRARDEIRATKPSFWFGVGQGVVASFLFAIFLGGIVFVSWSSKIGFKDAAGEVLGLDIKDKPSIPKAASSP